MRTVMAITAQAVSMDSEALFCICGAAYIKLAVSRVDNFIDELAFHGCLRYKASENIIYTGVCCFVNKQRKTPAFDGG
jgi:hypothetical protein